MDKLGFVILTWNSEKVIENCLNSILTLENYVLSVVIVDNGSTDKTKEIISRKRKSFCNGNHLELVPFDINMGTTKSRNIGLRKVLKAKWICVLDSDTIINQNAIDSLIAVLKENDKNGIVGPRMVTSSGIVQNSGRHIPTITEKLCKVLPSKKLKDYAEKLEKYEGIDEENVIPVGYLMSACWMMRAEVIQTVGLLDEKIFYAPEDVEYCIRAWLCGYRVLYDGKSTIIHEWQRLSRKKIVSKHNWEHIKGLGYMYGKYGFLFKADKIEKLVM